MQIIDILKYVEKNENSAFFYTPNSILNGKSYFFKQPVEVRNAKTENEVKDLLKFIDKISLDSNLISFAIVPYETGYYFQPKKIKNNFSPSTYLQIFVYKKENVEIIKSKSLEFDKVENYLKSKSKIKTNLAIGRDEYINKIKKIKNYISEGDTYQINFTTKSDFDDNVNIIELFLKGIFNQSAAYSAFINSKENIFLSFSPELFFKTDYKKIFSKPMKGTAKRKNNPLEDKQLSSTILQDKKNKAENVMIVDLIRNDIGKISEINSVKVTNLFEVEKYETLYQMTSTVEGKLKETKLSKMFEALFPCGSITGAPKFSSMKIINELENKERGIYTGSIGIISSKEAIFNIPIRTVTINKKTKIGEIGLGSGIVWDSNPQKEYEEVLLKGKFLSATPIYFELLETILYENGNYFLLDYHIERLKKSADYFLFNFNQEKVEEIIKAETSRMSKNKKYKVRILLNKWGKTNIEFSEIKEEKKNEIKVLILQEERCKYDRFLFNKTTYRPWDAHLEEARKKGYFEVLYLGKKEEILEGAISNIIIEKDNQLFTPPIESKILNGCYREYLINKKLCEEKIIYKDDLFNADKIILCNSVFKEITVDKIE